MESPRSHLTCPTPVPLAASPTRYSATILSPLMGSKRSALNYSFRMSNNACWLVFRLGGGGDPLNYSGPMTLFPSLQKKRSGWGSHLCLSVTRVREASVVAWLTLAVAAATAWAEQKSGWHLFRFTQASSTPLRGAGCSVANFLQRTVLGTSCAAAHRAAAGVGKNTTTNPPCSGLLCVFNGVCSGTHGASNAFKQLSGDNTLCLLKKKHILMLLRCGKLKK